MPRREEEDDPQEEDEQEESGSNDQVLQIEEDDDGSEETDDGNAEESDNEEKEPPPTPARKRMPIWVWILAGAIILLCFGLIGGGVSYFLNGLNKSNKPLPKPVNQTNPVEGPVNINVLGANYCTQRPIRWVKDVQLPLPGKEQWKVSVFSGIASFDHVRAICDRINKATRPNDNSHFNLLYINSEAEEDMIDNVIRENKDVIFAGLNEKQRIIWTGFFHYKNSWTKKWEDTFTTDYRNYCNPDWRKWIREEKDKTNGNRIYIYKDYTNNRINKGQNSCWGMFSVKDGELVNLMVESLGQQTGSSLKMPFVCTSEVTRTSGMTAIAGHLEPKREGKGSLGTTYITYGVRATLSEALVECRAQGARLVSVNSAEKEKELTDFLSSTRDFRPPYGPLDAYSWTGGFIDHRKPANQSVSWVNNRNGTVNVLAQPLKCPNFHQITKDSFDRALYNLGQRPDCEKQFRVFLVKNHVTTSSNNLKPYTDCWEYSISFDIQDSIFDSSYNDPRFYVLCEK